jgi:acetate kinase
MILVLNSGSATLKFQLFAEEGCRIHLRLQGLVELGDRPRRGVVTIKQPGHEPEILAGGGRGLSSAIDWLFSLLESHPAGATVGEITAVGHRVVHGGDRFTSSVLVTEEVLEEIERCGELAPLHNPDNLLGILASRSRLDPSIPHVAVFDTAFHQTMPERAWRYAIPHQLATDHRLRRYGFHGTSHRYVSQRFRERHSDGEGARKLITLHLGNGCSAAAIADGTSLDTSMGLTPLEGLVMGTRSGDLDPALYRHLTDRTGLGVHEIEQILNRESGLLGLSGLSGDMRVLLDAASGPPQEESTRRAKLAIEIFVYRIRKYIGAYLAVLEGAQAILFTGGIGENAPAIRARICAGFEWAGLLLDPVANQAARGEEACLTSPEASLAAWVIPTDEERMIALETFQLVASLAAGSAKGQREDR